MRQKAVTKDKKLLMVGPPVELADGERDQFDVVRFGEEDFVDYRGHPSSFPFAEREFDWTIVTLSQVPQCSWFEEWKRITKTKLSVRVGPML